MTQFSEESRRRIGPEMAGPGCRLRRGRPRLRNRLAAILSARPSAPVAFQLPELGLLTLAMLLPILTGGLNLANYLHRQSGRMTLAWVLKANGGADAASASSSSAPPCRDGRCAARIIWAW